MAISFASPLQGFGGTSVSGMQGGFSSPAIDRLGGMSPSSLMQQQMLLGRDQEEIMLMMMMLLGGLMNPQSAQNGSFEPGQQASGCQPVSDGSSAPTTSDSASTPGAASAGPINSPTDFAHALLQQLGDPDTAANVQSIVDWEKHEGGNWNNSAKFNPLNTTQSEAGDSSMNSVGVKAYTSWDQGLQATVSSLENGKYSDLLSALKSGDGLSNGSYQGLKTWSGGGYSSI